MAATLLEPERFALGDAIVRTAWGFDPAPAETALASGESRRSTADEFLLRNQLDGVSGYDAVLVDCPPILGVLTLNALAAASHLVLVTEPSFLALQGLDELLETRVWFARTTTCALRLADCSHSSSRAANGRSIACAETAPFPRSRSLILRACWSSVATAPLGSPRRCFCVHSSRSVLRFRCICATLIR